MKSLSVKIGDKNSQDDFNMVLTHYEISPPEVQTQFVEVPLRDGSLDFTEALTGDVRYKDRKITMKFNFLGKKDTFPARISELENFLHGRRLHVTFDDDVAFYYDARLSVTEYDGSNNQGRVTIEGIAQPYKYNIQSSNEDWLWDPFDFESGYINELSNMEIDRGTILTIIGSVKNTTPIVTTTDQIEIVTPHETFVVLPGTSTIYGWKLSDGENTIIIRGTATVSIDFRGGML